MRLKGEEISGMRMLKQQNKEHVDRYRRRRRKFQFSEMDSTHCSIPRLSEVGIFALAVILLNSVQFSSSLTIQRKQSIYRLNQYRQIKMRTTCYSLSSEDDGCNEIPQDQNRRAAMLTTATAIASAVILPSYANAKVATDSLKSIDLGKGQWSALDRSELNQNLSDNLYTATFAAYATRFLIRYDYGVSQWWEQLEMSLQQLSPEARQAKLGRAFGSLSKSLQDGFNGVPSTELYQRFERNYGSKTDASRHIALMFTMLPASQQPIMKLEEYYNSLSSTKSGSPLQKRIPSLSKKIPAQSFATTTIFGDNLTRLLPNIFQVDRLSDGSFTIEPTLSLYEVGVVAELGQTATATALGPVASVPLIRELPKYSPETYALFGLAGATGCALTHTIVIPLDVVKTRAQTDPTALDISDANPGESAVQQSGSGNMIKAGLKIVEEEGIEGLLLGAQATIAGYFWYGLSVYPSYTFFKRYLTQDFYSVDYAVAHGNEIALIAGALAAVVASMGLTPLEAARIRVVAEPDTYKPLGLTGTLGVIASEDKSMGWMNLYAGLPSLLTRQVVFGSVKFLAFERACEFIYAIWPFLRDATWTALTVSLVAGAFSGVLSSVVSQPADSVLTYVAKGNKEGGSLGLLEGASEMVAEEGPASLFRGLGSRCVWAGSIIAGQFLLYDIFRTFFGVTVDDLSQVFQLDILPT